MPSAAYTGAACRIARIERKKFDAVMASGEYTCAPKAPPGLPRIFEVPDLIGLFLFARQIERGQSVKQASLIACRVVGQVLNAVNNGQEIPQHVAVGHDMVGSTVCGTGDNLDPMATHMLHGTPMLLAEVWNVANLRAEVEKGLAEEDRIAGGGEEE